MHWAVAEIRKIQKAARSGKPIDKPRPPMVVLRSPKGWTGPLKLDGNPLVNSFRSHQVPLPKAATDDEQFSMLQDWLAAYHPESLWDFDAKDSIIRPDVCDVVPESDKLKLGLVKETWRGHQALDLPDEWADYGGAKDLKDETSPMLATGKYLTEVIRRNPKRFRIFSPDELASNKLNGVFDVTHRNFQWDPETAHKGGRVVEMLSEHTLQGYMQGYALTGRYSVFPSYEAFLSIVDTLIIQFAKFIKVAKETNWHGPIPSLTYIETSTLWRQEHNGYSHQQPGLVGTLLHLPRNIVRVYMPPDANTAVSTMGHCLRSTGYVNLIVGSKTPGPNYLSTEEADAHCIAGASVWKRFSTDEGRDPDVVLACAGVEVTAEVVHAANALKKDAPNLRVRVVNVTDLLVLSLPGAHPHALDQPAFESLFTADKPVVFNYHSYPGELASLLFGRGDSTRFTILGYLEQGTTTTPFSMLRMNEVDRYSVAAAAVKACSKKLDVQAHSLRSHYQHLKRKQEQYSEEHGTDPDELSATVLFEQ